jgi:hypothetical protein
MSEVSGIADLTIPTFYISGDPKQTNGGAVEPHRVPFRCWMTRSVGAELETQLGPGVEEAKKTCSQKDLRSLCEESHGQVRSSGGYRLWLKVTPECVRCFCQYC